ncbi:DUF4142 domain-containing protein [Nonomuraea dietziae]|uniref:DUF4142 domain-containing protein n=1 Tax=Nonomuraea dietziae TaxID=65515 RepID=UPI003424756A
MTNPLSRLVVGWLAALAAVLVLLPAASAAAVRGPQDEEYLRMAHQGNLAEIASGRAAQEKASSEDVRMMGEQLVTDHTKLDTDLKKVAEQLDISLPDEPDPRMAAELRKVSELSGQAFDAAWVDMQIKGHEKTLRIGKDEQSTGTETAVKQLAVDAAPVIEKHLRMAQELHRTMSPDNAPTG